VPVAIAVFIKKTKMFSGINSLHTEDPKASLGIAASPLITDPHNRPRLHWALDP
jgi:hypothetical protein